MPIGGIAATLLFIYLRNAHFVTRSCSTCLRRVQRIIHKTCGYPSSSSIQGLRLACCLDITTKTRTTGCLLAAAFFHSTVSFQWYSEHRHTLMNVQRYPANSIISYLPLFYQGFPFKFIVRELRIDVSSVLGSSATSAGIKRLFSLVLGLLDCSPFVFRWRETSRKSGLGVHCSP